MSAFEDDCQDGVFPMKIAGFLLLPAGWMIVASAIVLLPSGAARMAFICAGAAVEVLGMVLIFRAHLADSPGKAR
jgi:hypothetical protein